MCCSNKCKTFCSATGSSYPSFSSNEVYRGNYLAGRKSEGRCRESCTLQPSPYLRGIVIPAISRIVLDPRHVTNQLTFRLVTLSKGGRPRGGEASKLRAPAQLIRPPPELLGSRILIAGRWGERMMLQRKENAGELLDSTPFVWDMRNSLEIRTFHREHLS